MLNQHHIAMQDIYEEHTIERTGTCDMHLLSACDKNGTQELAKVALCDIGSVPESDNVQKC